MRSLFEHGQCAASQELAATFAERLETTRPEWATRFRIIEAESDLWRGMNSEALGALSPRIKTLHDSALKTELLALIGRAYIHLHRYPEAEEELAQAQALCKLKNSAACGELLSSQAGLAAQRGDFQVAYALYSNSLSVARQFNQPWGESVALTNLGAISLREERFDDAIDWLHAATRIAQGLGADDVLLNAIGNLGWAYYNLGDPDKALEMYREAESRAIALGDIGGALAWLQTAGYIFQDKGDWTSARVSFVQALDLAKRINSKDDIVNALEDLAHVSIEAGDLGRATDYLNEVAPMLRENGNRLDTLDVILAQGKIAAARRQDQQAESIFRTVEKDPGSQTSMRLAAEHEIAKLYELQGNTAAAEHMYKTTLTTFESARAQLKNEDSKLPFLANATRIYDDYIHFLVAQGKTNEALELADQSRARTLAEGLGAVTTKSTFQPVALHPNAMAQKTNSTFLFYWLGEKQSYLWAITPSKTALFPLPAQKEIKPKVEHYRKALLGPNNSAESLHDEGAALYQMLVAPAAPLIRPNSNVVILNDGALSKLNFETLIVPGPKPHYFIEDATLISAPSLHMLASAKSSPTSSKKLLILGDAVSPSPDYPDLPEAGIEMQQIQKHFTTPTVFAREKATSAAYLSSAPQQYSYIHFVTHGIASQTDPLDSAIILSRNGTQEESFKLYARDIIQHPIHADLVTISACYGSGTRSYVGEGLVGLSWAFLRAGAHNVIAALWEASDESTPKLMDSLYQGLEKGMSPSAALRQAKLSLLHSQGSFRKPFYWAPFQIYTGL